MIKRWFVAVAACGVLIVGLGWFKASSIQASIAEAEARPEYFETVETSHVSSVDYIPTIKVVGVAVSPQHVVLRNELAGYITEVNFSSGEIVQKGQTILQQDISAERAQLASAEARATLAKSVYERDLGLLASNAVSKEAVDRSKTDLDVILAEISGIESVIDRKTIKAPFTGKIGIHQFESGQYLDPNTLITNLIADQGRMWVDFSVPQFYDELDADAKVQVQLVNAHMNQQNQMYDAHVITSNSLITSTSRSLLYRALIEGENLPFRHNASVEVTAPIDAARPLFSVPTQAIQSSIYGKYVFTLKPEQKAGFYRAKMLSITPVSVQRDMTYISGDLNLDDIVAAAGAFKLRDGILVQGKASSQTAMTSDGDR